jgi:tetratricopeptide (TPR) repeat protein
MEPVGILEAFLGFTERSDGHNDAAREHLDRAKAIAEELHSDRIRAMAVNGLGSLAADEGDFATARQAKEQSLTATRALGDRWIEALISASLGKVCFGAGDYAAARKFMAESLALSRELGNKWAVPYAIELLADICAKEKAAEKAVRLYGAASALREALAMAFSVIDRSPYQQALRRLHELVPDETFEREWQAGRSLRLPSAIQLALE